MKKKDVWDSDSSTKCGKKEKEKKNPWNWLFLRENINILNVTDEISSSLHLYLKTSPKTKGTSVTCSVLEVKILTDLLYDWKLPAASRQHPAYLKKKTKKKKKTFLKLSVETFSLCDQVKAATPLHSGLYLRRFFLMHWQTQELVWLKLKHKVLLLDSLCYIYCSGQLKCLRLWLLQCLWTLRSLWLLGWMSQRWSGARPAPVVSLSFLTLALH